MNTRQQTDPVAAVALLDEPTRRRLYDYVVTHAGVGRDAAAKALGISRVLAAFHLDKLVASGLLSARYRRLSGRTGPGAGRPAKVYARSDHDIAVSLPARRFELPAEVFAEGLERLSTTVGPAAVADAVNEPARLHGRQTGRLVRRSAGPRAGRRRKREALLRQLTDDGFEPAVDAQTDTITLVNCPYRALSESHRELTCGMNLAWAEGLVEAAGTADLAPRLEVEPGRCCVVFAPVGAG
jgi:predicted ArsR family transcriptional regulator